MNVNPMKFALHFSALALMSLLGLADVAAQTTVNLTAQRMSTTLPDGKTAPMWGFCTTGSCSAAWAPGPQINVPAAGTLTINLTNALPTPTSIVILGQLGGGLGTPVKVASPAHATKAVTTWPANAAATVPFVPPVQADRAQSFGTETTANGGTQQYSWTGLRPGTYLYETGTNPSIQAPMGLYGVVVVTTPPTAGTPLVAGQAYPGSFANSAKFANVQYDADALVLLSEIDLRQNTDVDALAAVQCPAPSNVCTGKIDPLTYPAAVNYAPTYFLVNGQGFSKSNPVGLPVASSDTSGNVLLRFVNAGLRTHIPTVVGLNLQLVAEDGNVLPGNPKVQNEVLLPAGKVVDVVVNPPATSGAYNAGTFGIFDRALGLSAGNTPDHGMQTYLQVAGAALPAAVLPQAVNDAFTVPVNSATYSDNVLLNDIGIVSAAIQTPPTLGTIALNSDGTFTYTPTSGNVTSDSFTYCGNGGTTLCATATLTVAAVAGAPVAGDDAYTSAVATSLKISHPGVLSNDTDPSGYPLTAKADPAHPLPGWVTLNSDGSFVVTNPPSNASFQYLAVNSQGTPSNSATVTLTFPAPSGLVVSVVDAQTKAPITDYRWTIEEDTTFQNHGATNNGTPPSTLATNFHKSYMPVVATGCVGTLSCGTGQTFNAVAAPATPDTDPSQVVLDPTKHYYISVLPGDAANAFIAGGGVPVAAPTATDPSATRQFDPSKDCNATNCGHTMGGANITPGQKTVTVLAEPNPLQTAQLSVFIFEDNNPTNGDIDGVEENQGLGGFEIIVTDVAGRTGDPIGQMTYDAFNYPLTNALMGTPDCPAPPTTTNKPGTTTLGDPSLQGRIVTCPSGSKLAGHALIKNLMPGRFDVSANPGGARESAGETWYQVSTLEGTRGQDAFAKVGEPAYFQEFGPPGFHTFIGFVNPDHVKKINAGLRGTNTVKGSIKNLHMSRPIDEALNVGSHDPLAATTCYVSLNANAGSGANVAFAQCDDKGNFSLTGIPSGTYQLVAWDQWLDQIISFKNVTIPVGQSQTVDMGPVPVFSWFTRLETSTFLDEDGTHLPDNNPGVSQVPFTVRFRDGSISNVLKTDANGNATFSELFPLFNWYVIESDTTRFKGDAVHVVVDGGGAVDASGRYAGILTSKYPTGESSERLDPGATLTEGLQGYIGQTNITDWGKVPYKPGENGGINGTVAYASTRPFDDPSLLFQNIWAPLVPRVAVRLYQETTAPDGTQGLKFIEETKTSSWDDSVLGMQCPGQVSTDPFVPYTLGTGNEKKCYDGFHNWNQVQPAAYDGRYKFTTLADGTTPLPAGKYVVEMVVPTGYELVKEEDKNILIGDAWIAPVSQQFGGLSNIFIVPDQAVIGDALNKNNPNNNNITNDLGHPSVNVQFPACVGNVRRVPDYISLFPQSGQVSPFAGADRPLCDKKEVILADQQQSNADFFVFTSAHIASHYTGIILDDAASEINKYSPDFGEKFAVPFVPISIKDFAGVEISRSYADQWGTFNGLTPSSWEVNVPNPAGYSPNMLITCMNDPGPISDGKGGLITDPKYNPMFANFCYTNPFMPGLTDYLDTPVLPVAAFAAGYNPVDCAYPDATPAIKRVDSSVGFGPYLPATGGTVTITALGTVAVPNPAYGGPSATNVPFNQPTITRTYNFGATKGSVTLGGVAIPASYITSWSDSTIAVQFPAGMTSGELGVVAANGKSTVDSVTMTFENKAPTRVSAAQGQPVLQNAIDNANPGDLLLIDAGTYNELAIMWKPVRLQGVGAPSVIINAAKYPTNKLEVWRPKINALFGIDAQGNQLPNPKVDPLPGQEITGGVVLLEPSVLSSEEGAGITVLAKNRTATDCHRNNVDNTSNFYCAASRIDGIGVTGGDAGGGIYVNGWAHNLEIANNRVYGNAGAMNGGIRIGIPNLEALVDTQGGFGYNKNIHIHHNSITTNGTVEAGATASGAGGGLSMCSGTDNYLVDYNFICGNFSTSDGGGIGHIGVSVDAMIRNNTVLFNQSYNQGTTVHGGGITVEGELPAAAAAALTLGTGDVTIDANLIQGNFSQAGSGGGIRLQNVNGAEVNRGTLYKVTVTNNMIVNNVSGWAGGGISLADAVKTSIINNTISSNDSTGIVGPLFTTQPTTASPSPAGISTEVTSGPLAAALAAHSLLSPAKRAISNPDLNNNIIWQNRSFFFDASTGNPNLCSSNKASDAAGTTHTCVVLPPQATEGQCTGTPAYWDLGVVGDTSATPGTQKLNPTNSILSSTANYAGSGNSANNPQLASPYCNGSRAMPGQVFEPGQPFLPPFQFAAAATLDEAGNFVDLRYGPLTPTGNYRIQSTSPAIDKGSTNAPDHDFFGTHRPQGPGFDIGAHEVAVAPQVATLTPASLNFGNVTLATTSATLTATLANTGTVPVTNIVVSFAQSFMNEYSQTNNCGTTLAVNASCTISIILKPNLVPGTRANTLNVSDGAGTQSVSLTGNATSPSGTLSPRANSTINFGGVVRGQKSTPAKVVTLTNTGLGSLNSSASVNSAAFIIVPGPNACGATLAPGSSCTFNLVFAPAAAPATKGPKNGMLTIQDGLGTFFGFPIPGLPQTINLTGTAN